MYNINSSILYSGTVTGCIKITYKTKTQQLAFVELIIEKNLIYIIGMTFETASAGHALSQAIYVSQKIGYYPWP